MVTRTSRERRNGLLGYTQLPTGSGLWIFPCEAIHTFRMKFTIDVIFLDAAYRVLKLRRSVAAGRICICIRASSVLELEAGAIESSGTRPGDRLELRVAIGAR